MISLVAVTVSSFVTSFQADNQTRLLAPFLNLGVFLIVMVGLTWLLFIYPQQKQQKKHAAFLESLKPGDKVITNSGFYGTIAKVDKDKVRLKLNDTTAVIISRNAISGYQPDSASKSSS